ncbi:hypothetical protein [Bacillus ndiopicus]|uniref:hypothetical protein n=1 Tax=Bacillus ndiopicus TaxID=1347368 RepID=UPI0005AB088F|nr:hypothetical protein [Bacillus ndiopicus]
MKITLIQLSEQQSITIPEQCRALLKSGEKLTMEIIEDHLLIRPVEDLYDEYTWLLESMIAKGLSGQDLLETFKEAVGKTGYTLFKKE